MTFRPANVSTTCSTHMSQFPFEVSSALRSIGSFLVGAAGLMERVSHTSL